MGWSVGYDQHWRRWIGYGVPATCDHPDCDKRIDRGLTYVCCCQTPYGGENGCGLFFCFDHQNYKGQCERCDAFEEIDEEDAFAISQWEGPFAPKPEHPKWLHHITTHPSWRQWRIDNPAQLDEYRLQLAAHPWDGQQEPDYA